MKRVALRRKPKADPVTGLVRVMVIARDYQALRVAGLAPTRSSIICVARLLDPEAAACWGRTTLDHVKPHARMGVRARSVPEELVSLCQGHTEDGRKAGYQWNTANRPALRSYLASQPATEA